MPIIGNSKKHIFSRPFFSWNYLLEVYLRLYSWFLVHVISPGDRIGVWVYSISEDKQPTHTMSTLSILWLIFSLIESANSNQSLSSEHVSTRFQPIKSFSSVQGKSTPAESNRADIIVYSLKHQIDSNWNRGVKLRYLSQIRGAGLLKLIHQIPLNVILSLLLELSRFVFFMKLWYSVLLYILYIVL